jgi:hypothetical protein
VGMDREIGIGREEGEGGEKKKRGRVKKSVEDNKNVAETFENFEKSKFFIDVSKEIETRDLIGKLLQEANNKNFGREIVLRDLIIASIPKLTSKDIERIQESALTDMEKIERLLIEHNEKNKTSLTLGEFLVKKLNV